MNTITIPSTISRDQRDILVGRAVRQISLALRRLERLQAMPNQQQAATKDTSSR
jgi:hypothetical protein